MTEDTRTPPRATRPRLTLRDRHLLRRMLSWACEEAQRRCDSSIEAAEWCAAFARVTARIVPKGSLKPLKKPLFRGDV